MTEINEELSENAKANIAYHSALASRYDKEQPHFRPENIARVYDTLNNLISVTGNDALLDLGCGTGFIINVARTLFKRVVGVDITAEMLGQVDCSRDHVEAYLADSSNTALPSGSFDICTAYGFLHHLCEIKPTLQEAYRILRPGGIFYADQDPNHYYWDMIKKMDTGSVSNATLNQEIVSITGKVEEIAAGYRLSNDQIELAEYHKFKKNGFLEDELRDLLYQVGFTVVEFRYEWYLGQSHYLHNSPDTGIIIEKYLRDFLPATRNLFKYISFIARK